MVIENNLPPPNQTSVAEGLAGLQAVVDELRNQSLTDVVMIDVIQSNYKPPPLEPYDGKRDPQEHLTTFNTQMSIIGASETL